MEEGKEKETVHGNVIASSIFVQYCAGRKPHV